MGLKVSKRSVFAPLRESLPAVALFVLVAAAFIWGISDAEESSRREGKQVAYDSIMRAVVTCYAVEGSYPPSFGYIRENYGVSIDEKRYGIIYNIFAENIMPDITVIDLKGKS